MQYQSDSSQSNMIQPEKGQRYLSAASAAMDPPRSIKTVHGRGNMRIAIDNIGNIGLSDWFRIAFGRTEATKDVFTGEKVYALEFPWGSRTRYAMQGTLLIGARVGRDSLVSRSDGEFFAESATLSRFQYQSRNIGSPRFSSEALSDFDVICEYLDTFIVSSGQDSRLHKPLGIKVVQRGMSWTPTHIDDFVIFRYDISNIGNQFLEDVWVGMYAHGAVQTVLSFFDSTGLKADELTGFLRTYPTPGVCSFTDTLRVAYAIDNDGDPVGGGARGSEWGDQSDRAAVGVMFLELPRTNDGNPPRIAYNWWVSSQIWGPTLRARLGSTIRDDVFPFISHFARDKNAYYYLANGEVDYDQLTTWTTHYGEGYHNPPQQAAAIASGSRPYYLISAGPFDLAPNETKTVSLAVVGGETIHQDPRAHQNFDPARPLKFFNTLDFSKLASSARSAQIVFDNPGVDTDGDGYFGEFRLCQSDTIWYSGDGVPDYSADGPPQQPRIHIIPENGKLTIRWNGFRAETTEDPFTATIDFEGYHVYIGLDDRPSGLTLVASYDLEDYNRFVQTQLPDGTFDWKNNDIPFTLDSLRTIYADPNFAPLIYTRTNPLFVNDSNFYFTTQDFNEDDLSRPGGIKKVFPNALLPDSDPNLWTTDDVTYLHGEPLPRFYEYEFVVSDLLETIPYFVTVTSFDFGFAAGGIAPQESDKSSQLVRAFPTPPAESVINNELDVYIYPNPYRIDGGYSKAGFENRGLLVSPERARRVHFVNVPNRCTIYIYSIDGDLVQRIYHDLPANQPDANHASWDLITRNTMSAASGIYYWVVESKERTQIGKLVIIK